MRKKESQDLDTSSSDVTKAAAYFLFGLSAPHTLYAYTHKK